MAVHANSTTAPAVRLLRAAGPCAVLTSQEVVVLTARPRDARGRFVRVEGMAATTMPSLGGDIATIPPSRPELPSQPLLQAEAPEPATLDDVRRRGDRTSIVPKGNNAPATAEDLGLTRKDTPDAVRRHLDALVARRGDIPTRDTPAQAAQQTARRKELYEILHPETAHGGDRGASRQFGDLKSDRFTADTAAHTGRPERSIQRDAPAAGGCHMSTPWELPAEPDTAARARTLHLRRQLATAIDHGADMLAALGLPRPVDGEFIAVDPQAAGDAIEAAVAALDALDGDPEAEPSLGWYATGNGVVFLGDASDREDDSEEDEGTALERHGRGFVRAGDDDAEEDDAAEESDEPEGDGGESYLSVVEWDGRGDNWGRSGHATSPWGTDVEDVNEDGPEEHPDPWALMPAVEVQRVEAAHG